VPRKRVKKHRQLTIDPCAAACGCRVHVQHPIPHLVEKVLPKTPPALDQCLDLHRLRIIDERRHYAQE
jgi:hypothetical protein